MMSTAKLARLMPLAFISGPACSVISGLSDYELADSAPSGTSGAQTTGIGGTGGGTTTGPTGTAGAGGAPAWCGDSVIDALEACDDGNSVAGDGCTDCTVDFGYTCEGEPSACAPIPPVLVSQGPGLGIVIPDDERYDGSIASMTCVTLAVPDLGAPVVRAVELYIGIDHTYLGDLVIKVVSPQGTVTTVMSRPGVTDEGDTSFETNGNGGRLAATHPIRFAAGEPDPAEDMGSGVGMVGVACRDDLRCDYGPVADSGPGNGFVDFQGEPPLGDWLVCAADGDDGEVGTIDRVELSVLAW